MTPHQLLEYGVRKLYFANPSLVAWYQRFKVRRSAAETQSVTWQPELLGGFLRDQIPAAADIIVHSSIAGLGGLKVANPQAVLQLFRQIGQERGVNLLFPTHPLLKTGSDGVLEYDPRRSPSTVGVISEFARRASGFQRSRHPLSSVAVCGPDADWYLRDNLQAEGKSLPHGRHSPYARLAERGGYAVCLGVSFERCLTMIHVAEELLDDRFPRGLEFEELPVRIREGDSTMLATVRRRSPRQLPNWSLWGIQRDLVAVGAVRRHRVGGVIVDIADCRHVVSYMQERALRDGYPYLFLPKRKAA
ncbi:MAG: AAC(3) family N-acetyltransferase [Planctomycetaceae bacterium]|nr:AAC(3) family N-acetyltransferase [Planctomycetaceae bacterium]